MKAPECILNRQNVVAHFGHWPSFHDSSVLDYERPASLTPCLGFSLHAWNITAEVDAKGFFVLKDHALVSFRFWDIRDLEMETFDSGNILFGMQFFRVPDSSRFKVTLDSVMGMDGSFSASRGEVLQIVYCTEDGKMA